MGPGVLVRVAADILLLNHELLAALVVELGGDGNTNTVNELTVVPSEDVESCIRGLHINGALVPPIATWHPGTGVAIAHDCCWRGPTALGAPLPLFAPVPSPPTPFLAVARVQKQDGARERPATPEERRRSAHKGMVASGAEARSTPRAGRALGLGSVRSWGTIYRMREERARVSLDWSAAVRALETAKSLSPTSEAVFGRGKRRFSAVLQAGDEREFHMLPPAMLRGLEERFVEKNGGPRETTKTRLRSNSLPSPLALHRTKLRTQTSPSSPRSASGQ